MDSNTKFLAGLAAGLGIGTVLGLLLAPEKGTETYKKVEGAIKDVANDLIEFGREKAQTLQKETKTAAKKAKA